jgi:integrase
MLGDKAELVFPGIVEAYERDPSAVSKLVQKTFEKAGLAVREDRPGVTRAVVRYGAHSLRHFYATQALAAGIPAEIVKRITGHTSDDMLSNYEHVDAAMIGGLAEKLSHGKKLLPAATDGDWRGKVRTIAKGMTAKTWKAARKELLELAAN